MKKGQSSLGILMVLAAMGLILGSSWFIRLRNQEKEVLFMYRDISLRKLKLDAEKLFQSADFVANAVLKPNPILNQLMQKFIQGERLEEKDFPSQNEKFLILNIDGKKWLGEEARLAFPNLEPCEKEPHCLFKSEVKLEIPLTGEVPILNFRVEILSLKPNVTGAIHQSRRTFPLRFVFNKLNVIENESRVECRERTRLVGFSFPPLQLECTW